MRPASDARLLWSRDFDPTVLSARASGAGPPKAPSPDTIFLRDGAEHRIVIGGACRGIRIDVLGGANPFDLARLRFELAFETLPNKLHELRRLFDLLGSRSKSVTHRPFANARAIGLLRTIDALGEGASLRMIGEGLVRAGDWPGAGESTKSKARRLAAAATAMWHAGPQRILKIGR